MIRLKGRPNEITRGLQALKSEYGASAKAVDVENDLRREMKMLVCEECGRTYSEDSLVYFTERHGFSAAETRGEKFSYSRCGCGGELVEATRCSICGDWANKYGVCKNCVEERETIDVALSIGEDNKDEVYINGYAAFLLSEAEINEILVDYIKRNAKENHKKIKEYCEEDMWYFAGLIERERGKN